MHNSISKTCLNCIYRMNDGSDRAGRARLPCQRPHQSGAAAVPSSASGTAIGSQRPCIYYLLSRIYVLRTASHGLLLVVDTVKSQHHIGILLLLHGNSTKPTEPWEHLPPAPPPRAALGMTIILRDHDGSPGGACATPVSAV